jgi:hypothetical protein
MKTGQRDVYIRTIRTPAHAVECLIVRKKTSQRAVYIKPKFIVSRDVFAVKIMSDARVILGVAIFLN